MVPISTINTHSVKWSKSCEIYVISSELYNRRQLEKLEDINRENSKNTEILEFLFL
jgi:hypothetical protein